MADNQRVEVAARALARHRLARSIIAETLRPDLAGIILDRATERFWPLLLDEARTVVAALDDDAPSQDPEATCQEATLPDGESPELP